MANKLRLRQATPATLDLRRYWIEQLAYREVEESPDALPETSIRVSLPEMREGPDGGEYLMTIRIRASQGEAREIDVTIAGLYRLETGDERHAAPPRILRYNGTAILFSAARGVIESVTSISGLGRMHVPSVDIAALLDR